MNHTTQPTLELLPNPTAAAGEQETPPAPAHTEASPGLKVRASVRAGLGAPMMNDAGTRRP